MLLQIVCAGGVLFLLSACMATPGQSKQSETGNTSIPGVMSAAHPTLPVQERHVSIAGNQQTILADSRGFTLYFYLPDTPTQTACTGSCTLAWPPLLAHDRSIETILSLAGMTPPKPPAA